MAMQRVLVLGATGGTGRHVVSQAIELGLDVTALVRAPARLPTLARPIRVVTADARTASSDARAAYDGQDAVISALGVGQSFRPDGFIASTVPRIVAAMREHGVRRLVFTSAFGIGPTWESTPLLPRLFIRTMLKEVYADKAEGERAIRESELDWTIVHPAGLTDGPRTGAVRVGEQLSLKGWFPHVSRADVAAVLLQQIADPTFVRKTILVAQ